MNKNLIISIIVVVLAGVAAFYGYKYFKSEELTSEKAAKVNISTFSLEGEVISKEGDTIVVKAGRVERTSAGNRVVEYEKVVQFKDGVKFSQIFRADLAPKVISRAELLRTLQAGDKAVFYGSGEENKVNGEIFVADRVEVLSRGQ